MQQQHNSPPGDTRARIDHDLFLKLNFQDTHPLAGAIIFLGSAMGVSRSAALEMGSVQQDTQYIYVDFARARR
jgi:hypothetical protein